MQKIKKEDCWHEDITSRNEKMSKKKAPPKTAPPEAYAAFVRIYTEWMEKGLSEQMKLVEKSVRTAHKVHSRSIAKHKIQANKNNDSFSSGGEFYTNSFFGRGGPALYGAEFDEYVNEVWASFSENNADVDGFAVYLQKDLERKLKDYAKQRDIFLRELDDRFRKIDLDITNMSDEEADKYLDDKYVELSAEIDKWKKKHDVTDFSSLDTLLRRPAQNMMAQLMNDLMLAIKGGNIVSETNNNTDGRVVEGLLVDKDMLERVLETFSPDDKKIFELWDFGLNGTEIAEKMNMSNGTISNRLMKKILPKIGQLFGIPLNPKPNMNEDEKKEHKANMLRLQSKLRQLKSVQ